MTRTLMLAASLAVGCVGCTHFQPIGPLAGSIPGGAPAAPAKAGGKPVAAAPMKGDVPDPIITPAPKPTPPAMLVTPAEVTAENQSDAVRQLIQELEQDRKTMPAARTAEVSVIKGGFKE